MSYYRVILRRANGRYVKELEARSKYAAKLLRDKWEGEYDEGYYVDIVPLDRKIHAINSTTIEGVRSE